MGQEDGRNSNSKRLRWSCQLSCIRAAHAPGNRGRNARLRPVPTRRLGQVAEQPSCIVETCVHPTPCRQETPTETQSPGRALEPPGLVPVSSSRAWTGAERSVRTGQGQWPGEGTRDRNAGVCLPPRRALRRVPEGSTGPWMCLPEAPVRGGSLPVAGLAVECVGSAVCVGGSYTQPFYKVKKMGDVLA